MPIRIQFDNLRNDPRYAHWVTAQPSWVWKIAAVAAAAVLIIPIVLVVLCAIGMFLAVFLIGSLVHWLVQSVSGIFGPRDGRRNVRVVRVEQ